MSKRRESNLSRREREMMDIIYERGQATAAEVRDEMSEPPSYSAVRATLRILEDKGHVQHQHDGPRYVFRPAVAREKAKRSAVRHLIRTFFDGSAEQAVTTLLDESSSKLSSEELDRLTELIEKARSKGA